MELLRLDKFIANNTEYSRKEVKALLKRGLISLNDKPIKQSDIKINADEDKVCVDGKIIDYNKYIYIMLNKPAGYVCSTKDGLSPTVLELLEPEIINRHKGIFPAGRLDKDTEGLVLLTNDGGLAHKILSPKKHIPKYYLVKLYKPFKESYIERFAEGIEIDGGKKCLPAKVAPIKEYKNYAFIELFEGKYHQIKRMFNTVENSVEYLFRTQMGGLILHEKLGIGAYSYMLHKDVEKLYEKDEFALALEKSHFFFSSYLINSSL